MNLKERKLTYDLIEIANNIRKDLPDPHNKETNDAKALGIAIAKAFRDPHNIASVFYHALNEVDKEKADQIANDWDKKYNCYIKNGHRSKPDVKGLLVWVYNNQEGDSSLMGVTSRRKRLILVGEGVPEIFEADTEDEIITLCKKQIGDYTHVFAKPYEEELNEVHTMFGGNFIYTSDSRFPSRQPIPVHDRIE